MSEKWDDELFKRFADLRDSFKAAKRAKDHARVIEIGKQIIELDKIAKSLQIATPLFQRDVAKAFAQLGDKAAAIEYYRSAMVGLTKMNRQGDWSKDIEQVEQQLAKLS